MIPIAERERRARRALLVEAAIAVALCLLFTALFVSPAWGTTITIQPSAGDSSKPISRLGVS